MSILFRISTFLLQDPRILDPPKTTEPQLFFYLKSIIGLIIVLFLIYLLIMLFLGGLLNLFFEFRDKLFRVKYLERLFLKPKSLNVADQIIKIARKEMKPNWSQNENYPKKQINQLLEKQYENIYPYLLESIDEKLVSIRDGNYKFTIYESMLEYKGEEYLKLAKTYLKDKISN
jgi:hypothetical protein